MEIVNDKEWTSSKVNEHITEFLKDFQFPGYQRWVDGTKIRKDIWEEFGAHQDDGRFYEWTEHVFAMADKPFLKELRDYLLQNNVYVSSGRGMSMATALSDTANETERHIWSKEEVEKQQLYQNRQQARATRR
ncbi:hypothetical protein GcM1_100006 [Golovinomyces cichoracearum]|uniref:Uncharacterized protein n=1 Tax=Golovinomyces cichoracearum TaxID=62708 RepID=A0A420JC75_9PEZI|nr:hypothetical protein GcM1_100006 [Golovinomyces cichoracearum]